MDQVEHRRPRISSPWTAVPTAVMRFDRVLPVSSGADLAEMFLLLPKHTRRPMGLLLSEVIDSDDLTIQLHREAYHVDGLLGSGLLSEGS